LVSNKIKNMKQLLSLSLFLLPCLAWAQYPSNGNQKITLGEQTTADGLIWRGVAADTTLTAKSDTAAYFVLDTVNINLYTYKASATGRKWRQLGADTASIAYVNTYGTQTVNGAKTFTSAVTATRFNPTANTATGNGMFLPATNTLGFSTNGTNKMTLDASGNLGLGITPNLWVGVKAMQLGHLSGLALYGYSGTGAEISSNIFFDGNNYVYTTTNRAARYALSQGQHRWFIAPSGIQDAVISDNQVMTIYEDGNVGINVNIPTQKLHVVGNARITAMNAINDIGADANGVLQAATSDMNLKNTIENSPFGLNEILLLNPVTFLYNDINRKLDSDVKEVGFIAQDVFDIIPNAISSTGTGDLQLDYRAITATLVKAIQEQQALIKALEQRIINLENK
jgi:hypothetical protein